MAKMLLTASTMTNIKDFHLPYCRAWAEEGYEITLACPAPEPCEGVENLCSLPLKKSFFSPQNWKALRIYRKLMKKEGFDVLVCHTALASFVSRLTLFGLKQKPYVICVIHGYLFHEHGKKWKNSLLLSAEKLLAKRTDLLLCMNQWDYAQAQKHELGKKITLISGMGVDLEEVRKVKTEGLRESLSLPEGSFLLLFGGEFSKRKNQRFLISALKALPEDIHLALAGRGEEEIPCKTLVKALALQERVHFLGYVSNLPSWYAVADLLVSGTASEGLPFHVMEAMAVGTPCLLSDVKGHRDLIEDGVNGALFPWGNEGAFGEKVLALREQPEVLKVYGEKSMAVVEGYGERWGEVVNQSLLP